MKASYIKLTASVSIDGSEYNNISNAKAVLEVDFEGRRGVTIRRDGLEDIFIPFSNIAFCRLEMPKADVTYQAPKPAVKRK
ncbi:MAG: hypothetical protein M3R04_02465 [bacterium]|nr:hypothetical protein [bacterium]